jgi:hypothetical protein
LCGALGLVAVLAAAALAGPVGPAVQAQAPTPGPPPAGRPLPIPPQPTPPPAPASGDVLWTFASQPPLNDLRVQLALAALVHGAPSAAGLPAARWQFVSQPTPGRFESRGLPARDQVPLLLAAAGIDPGALSELRPCLLAVAQPPVDVSPVTAPAEVGLRLAEAAGDALRALGVRGQACTVTANANDADVVAWYAGGQPPRLLVRPAPSWITTPGLGQPPARGPAAQAAAPPRTGNAGLAGDGEGAASAGLLVAALVASIAAARLTRRRERASGTRRG